MIAALIILGAYAVVVTAVATGLWLANGAMLNELDYYQRLPRRDVSAAEQDEDEAIEAACGNAFNSPAEPPK